MGKGLGVDVLIELLFYASANVIPLALPLAILLSSIMTFGALAEKNELTAMKSAGLSLFKVMRPLIILMIFISAAAFYFSNYTWPAANFKMRVLITDIQNQKPTLAFPEGIFYHNIEGYSILINKKNKDQSFEDILIYDYTEKIKNQRKTIHAESGKMKKSTSGDYAILELYNGVMYQEMRPSEIKKAKYPFQKSYFDKASIKFDLKAFSLNRSDNDMYKHGHQMQNVFQLGQSIDSLHNFYKKRIQKQINTYQRSFLGKIDTSHSPTANPNQIEVEKNINMDTVAATAARYKDSIYTLNDFNTAVVNQSYSKITREVRNNKKLAEQTIKLKQSESQNLARHYVEWHRKFTLSIACIILFFIGAPLGAIIKRGGLGTPVVFATVLYLIYYIISITGEKMAKTGVVEPWWGMWMSSIVLFPVGLFITYKAATDSKIFDREAYSRFLKRLRLKKK